MTDKIITVKYVRKAGAWCRTTKWHDRIEGNKQKQEWFLDEQCTKRV